jgi:hypothetical protein
MRAKEISESYPIIAWGPAHGMDAATTHLISILLVPDDILAGVFIRVILTFARASEIALESLHAYYPSASEAPNQQRESGGEHEAPNTCREKFMARPELLWTLGLLADLACRAGPMKALAATV